MRSPKSASIIPALVASVVACAAPTIPLEVTPETNAPPQLATNDAGVNDDAVNTACVRLSVRAEPVPAHLVVLLDRSNSMCKVTTSTASDCSAPTSRWQLTTSALEHLFASQASAGLTASLIAFPNGANTCDSNNYQTPLVANVALPDATSLATKIASVGTSGSTPTRDAIKGGLAYLAALRTKNPKERVAFVLATDGLPKGCSDANDVGPAAALAASVAGQVPTYVVGIGPDLAALDRLAQAGGTGKALIAASTDPAKIGLELTAALTAIRRNVLACELALPTPPAGETLDTTKVNVEVKTGGATKTLAYSAGCADPNGWRYDDAAKPTRAILCPAACSATKADASAEIGMVVGCETKGDVPR